MTDTVVVASPDRGEAKPPRRLGTARNREALAGYLFILPVFLGTAIFNFYPIFRSLYLSLTETGVFAGETFVGLQQYVRLFQDEQMLRSVFNTLIYATIGLAGIPLAVIFAGLLTKKGLRFVGGYRVLYFLPVVTMPVAVGLVWGLLFNTDYGIINQFLTALGLSPVPWLTDPSTMMIAIALVGIWASLGQNIVLMLAGLQSVPGEQLEAATLDGAGPVRRFLRISVPMASPTIFLVSILTVISSLQVFDLVFVMIGSTNPNIEAAQTIVYYFYKMGVEEHDRGYGAAIVSVLLVLTLLVTLIQFRLQRKWVHYE
ncbi:sugar ABC transporter permease [Microbacterium esteraromaticum]|uniref:carbohydrate ABC transporter permease n=1 Tax=Microbacterium esteraromaticum TaxID=57043 RepID=UPI0015CAA934|nr:sugar ABC transporter permease [Microbacterium esteraromaticum]MBN8424960.1 sugar ABC transporter permease [Microbacterium esteraromaticum]